MAAWLRALPDAALVRLLTVRPDLATPPPPDFDVLAARLEIRVSVTRALERLDTFTIEVAEALALAPAPVGRSRLEAFCGGLDLAAPLHRLVECGLVWGDDTGLHLVDMARELLGERPLRLGRPLRACLSEHRYTQLSRLASALGRPAHLGLPGLVDDLVAVFTDPVQVGRLAEACSPQARRILERLAVGPPLGTTDQARRLLTVADARSPIEELLARGLLVAVDDETVELPREVGLALRADLPAGVLHPNPPELPGALVGADVADATAAGAADTLVRMVTTLLETWGRNPLVPLRTSGVGVRDLRAAARLLDVGEAAAATVVEVAAAAGLVAASSGEQPRIVPTSAYDRWVAEPQPLRWAVLVQAWSGSAQVPGLVGERGERGRQVAAMSADACRAGVAELRAMVLGAMAAAEVGVAPTPESVRELLAWSSPRRGGAMLERMVEWTFAEAELLGVTGRGALSSAGRLLATTAAGRGGQGGAEGTAGIDRETLAAALEPMLPDPVDTLVFQADLTAVATGPLVPRVAAELARMADIESAGAATVYRFSDSSLCRALDGGFSVEDIHAFLATISTAAMPQALAYLVDDTGRRHGRLRSGPAASYLRCDDTVLLSEVMATRRSASLGLRRIAPTVVISSLPVVDLLEGLRAAGFAAVAEGPDGRVVLERPEVHRIPAKPAAASRPAPQRADQNVRNVVHRVRRGDDSSRAARAAGTNGTLDHLAQSTPVILVALQGAVRDGRRVLLGYVDQQGAPSERIVWPTAMEGGWLTAWDERSGGPRRFVLHRVTGVADIGDIGDIGGPGGPGGAARGLGPRYRDRAVSAPVEDLPEVP